MVKLSPPYSTLGWNVVPSHYVLIFKPDLQHFQFQASAHITVDVQTASKIIKLHAKELEITSAHVVHDKQEQVAKTSLDARKEELTLTLPKPIQGKAVIHLLFKGKHNDGMYGFYRSTYQLQGKTQHLLTSQFEAANARTAFPCFDEPAFKATFDVTLILDSHLEGISNMPVKKMEKVSTGKVKITFKTTPRMSTYLLYLGAGNFKSISTTHRAVTIRVVTTPDKIQYGQLALNYTKTFLAFFERYFGIRYPLPKLDIIAIPDFAAGAMENWGAMTFREIAVLGDENTSVAVKQNIAITVAHELAHQWFGNLVTMQWWEDLWLNESFATFMSYKAVHDAFPDWDLPLQYFYDTITDAMSADQLESTHPISVVVKTPGEVDEIFDRISYEKGGSVLHMLEDYVSPEVFRQGLHDYLKEFAYANAAGADLWTAIQKVYHKKDVGIMMLDWITQPGYPVLNTTRTKKGFSVTQSRFTLLGKMHAQKWLVPLRYVSPDGKPHQFQLKGKAGAITEKGDWIKLNASQHGFYRVQYETQTLEKLGSLIRLKKISPLDAAGIENDLFYLMVAGKYSLLSYLSFVEKYCLDGEYPLNMDLSTHLSSLFNLTYGKNLFPTVQRVSLLFHRRQFQKFGWTRKPGEKNTTTLLRSMTLANLCLGGEQSTLAQMGELFNKIRTQGKDAVDQNIRGAAYLVAAWQGDKEKYNYFVERCKNESIPEESRRLLRALGMFRDYALVQQALDLSQSSHVRLQDSYMIPYAIGSNPAISSDYIWKWTKKNWKQLMSKYNSGTHMLSTYVHNLSGIEQAKIRDEIKKFLSTKNNYRDDIGMALKQTIERININIKMQTRNGIKK